MLFKSDAKTWPPADLLYDYRITEVEPREFLLEARLTGETAWKEIPYDYQNGLGENVTIRLFPSVAMAQQRVRVLHNKEQRRRKEEEYRAGLPRVIEEVIKS